jgi:negative regulator of flagellin synthesis FlgM
MKINDSIKTPLGFSNEKVDANTSKKTDAASVDSSTSESVTLSPLASQLKSLEAKVAADNVYDSDKVDSIKSAISSGQFSVDSGKVADGLIQTVKDLLAKK